MTLLIKITLKTQSSDLNSVRHTNFDELGIYSREREREREQANFRLVYSIFLPLSLSLNQLG